MTPDRWQQIDRLLELALEREPGERAVLLESALEREPSDRARFLDQACGADTDLRREVEGLVRAHDQAGSFLDQPQIQGELGVKVESRLLLGQHLTHYEVISRLGEGGMGVVYKARDQQLGRYVAIKVLPPHLVSDPERKKRFVQEAKAASALNHPNIITIHEIANHEDINFIVMEYVEGKTLAELIPRRGLKLDDVLKYGTQIASALAKAHSAGIIHRDLKPTNVMVTDEGLLKVLDFGLAKLTEVSESGEGDTRTLQSQTEEGMVIGTLSYMSPEQAQGKKVDARSDIFSFDGLLSRKLCLSNSSGLLKTRLKHGIELRKSRGDAARNGSPSTLLQR
jgi:serine/threonine protein kinase